MCDRVCERVCESVRECVSESVRALTVDNLTNSIQVK